MADFNSRKIIETLRSGVSSREVGRYFSSARPKIMREIDNSLDRVTNTREPAGMVIAGRYGEGKTHLLNTVVGMAHEKNMVVSILQLNKETLMYKLHDVYPKIIQSTYLPGHLQPGFSEVFEEMTPNSPIAAEMLEYALTSLETDKLYYMLKSYLNSSDDDEKYRLLADLEGNFIVNNDLKRIFKRIHGERAAYKMAFNKTKHTMDYIGFLSHLFLQLGYSGWAILFDEAELICTLGKKTRQKAYANIARLLWPKQLEAVFCMFAFSAFYVTDIIEGKKEFASLEMGSLDAEAKKDAHAALTAIIAAQQLAPLSRDELQEVVAGIVKFHAQAYEWQPAIGADEILDLAEKASGQLLRAKIRAAIEILDQQYQYGQTGDVVVGDVAEEKYSESPDAE